MKMSTVYYIATLILTTELVMVTTEQCGVYEFKSPFYPGESCEDIYNKNTESHERSGYYWITDGPSKVYCGMTYTGSSCEDIYYNNPETRDNSGYYRINDNQWTYCNMSAIADGILSSCAGMGGEWKRIANIDISAGDDCPSGWLKTRTLVLVSVALLLMMTTVVLLPTFPLMEQVTRESVVEQEDIRRELLMDIMDITRQVKI